MKFNSVALSVNSKSGNIWYTLSDVMIPGENHNTGVYLHGCSKSEGLLVPRTFRLQCADSNDLQ